MNPYEILELSPGASAEEIKLAYHRLAKQWHPDKFVGPAKEEAESRFRQLAEAFSMLKDVGRGVLPVSAPASAPASEMRIDLEAEPAPRERNAEDWFSDAKAAFDQRNPAKALGLVHFAIKMDATKAEYHVLMAHAVALTTQDKKAESKALETAIRLNPKDVDSTIRLAELFQSVGMHTRATTLWQTARRISPDHPLFSKVGASKESRDLKGQWANLVGQIKIWLDGLKSRR